MIWKKNANVCLCITGFIAAAVLFLFLPGVERTGYFVQASSGQIMEDSPEVWLAESGASDIPVERPEVVITDLKLSSCSSTQLQLQIDVRSAAFEPLLYQIWAEEGAGWRLVKEYEDSFTKGNTFRWYPKNQSATGKYKVNVRVKGANSNFVYEQKSVEAICKEIQLIQADTPADTHQQIVDEGPYALLKDVALKENRNGSIRITAVPADHHDACEYRFTISESMRTAQVAFGYSPRNIFNWMPQKSGIYLLMTYIRHRNSNRLDDGIFKYHRVVTPGSENIKITNVELSHPEGTYPVGTEMAFTVYATGRSGKPDENRLQYSFWRMAKDGYRLIQDYSPKNTYSWMPVLSGVYTILVRVKDTESGSYEDEKSFTYRVIDPEVPDISVKDLTVEGSHRVGTIHKVIASAEGSADLMYKFIVTDRLFGWRTIRDFSPDNTCEWVPRKAGAYSLIVWVRDPRSGSYEESVRKEVVVTDE